MNAAVEAKLVYDYVVRHARAKDLAAGARISGTVLYRILHKHGVDTRQGRRIRLECTWCGQSIYRIRSKVRRTKHPFCNNECYDSWLRELGTLDIANCEHQKIARILVSQYFDLEPENVVHQEDGDCYNNEPTNLKVFANQTDHVQYHRGFNVEPLWSGRDLVK